MSWALPKVNCSGWRTPSTWIRTRLPSRPRMLKERVLGKLRGALPVAPKAAGAETPGSLRARSRREATGLSKSLSRMTETLAGTSETGCAMRVAVTVISSRAMAGSGANWAVATVGASAAVKRSARERGRVLETSMVSGQKMSASTMRAGGKVQLWSEFFREVSRGRAGGVAAIYRSTRSRGMDFFRCRWEFLGRGGQKI